MVGGSNDTWISIDSIQWIIPFKDGGEFCFVSVLCILGVCSFAFSRSFVV